MTDNINVARSRRAFRPATIPWAPLQRAVLRCLCGAAALAAVACADGGGVATSPSASAAVPGSPAAVGSTVSLSERVDGAKSVEKGRPFHGSFTGRDENEFQDPDILLVHWSGTGNASHLGRFRATFDEDVVLGLETAAGDGTFTLTAANGDTVVGIVTVVGTFVPTGVEIVETATITGGTGRFAGATGSFTLNRSLVEPEQTSSGSFEGTISY